MTKIVKSDNSTLYLGDCLEVMDQLIADGAKVDVVITDPPYNIGFPYSTYADNLPDKEYMELIKAIARFPLVVIQYPEETMRLINPAIGAPDHVGAWCYNSNIPRRFRLINYYGLTPDYDKVKVPYKNQNDRRVRELIESGSTGTGLYEWFDDIQLVKNVSAEKTEHPCPIPLKLAKRLILLTTNEGDTVLDPFMGGGTLGEAAIELKRKFIGIEIDPDYFEIAAQRIKDAESQMVMF